MSFLTLAKLFSFDISVHYQLIVILARFKNLCRMMKSKEKMHQMIINHNYILS